MNSSAVTWTDEELMALPRDGSKRELIGGEIIMSPAGFDHERLGARLLTSLSNHVERHALGVVCGSSLGCRMANGDVLSPDVSFIVKERIPRSNEASRRFFPGAPDLVAEILSPFDTLAKTRRKLQDYFENGTRLAWVLNPDEKSVLIYRTPFAEKLLRGADTMDGEDVVPGFRLALAGLFADPGAL
ncbi:MAG: Uma2 family endonuclease [Opitutaceae bacterium]